MSDLLTELNDARRESPSWRLYGLCHRAASRISELEAEVARLTGKNRELLDRCWRLDNRAEIAEAMECGSGRAALEREGRK